jgi:nucleotide-binding universal stress UspA family protein
MKILVCTDGSENASKAVRWAANFAQNCKGDLILFHVIKGSRKDDDGIRTFEETKEQGAKILDSAKTMVNNEFPGVNTTVHLDGGHTAKSIVNFAEKKKVGSIVLGTRGAGEFRRLLLGSVAQKVIVYAHCPVTVVR